MTMHTPTTLDYFHDMSCLQSQATFLAPIQEGDRLALILDRTIFYPQGGGQPADHGWISDLQERLKFRVEDVRLKDGLVYHYGFFNAQDGASAFHEGQEVCLWVDKDRRQLNARLHSAGHLLDICMRHVGLASLEGGKGHHFPDGPFVEYKGAIPAEEMASKQAALEAEANRLVSVGGTVKAALVSYEEAEALCGGQLPDYISKGSNPRIVSLGENVGCPCGGTHVADISDIGHVKVTQIRVRKGVTKVSYSLS